MLSPGNVLLRWVNRILSLGLVIAAISSFVLWFTGSIAGQHLLTGRWGFGLFALAAGVGCSFWALAGHRLHPARLRAASDGKVPATPTGGAKFVVRPDGSKLFVEARGALELPTVVLVHGWSLNSDQWVYLQAEWREKFRMVTYDLAGMGRSGPPRNHDYSIDKMAHDLRAVIEESDASSVVLLGHSIGGMIILKFCELFPELLGTNVSKLVLVHTTYTNPLKTMADGGWLLACQNWLVVPLIYFQIYTWPLMWLADYLCYLNGSLHWSLQHTGFAGKATRQQIDFVARFYANDSPAVLARGALGMLAFDGTAAFPLIKIPVLVVGAEQDPLTNIEASRKIANEIESAKLYVFDPAKHFALIEYHKDFATQTAAFCLGSDIS
ncbi:MAG TPA: alpha/beta hydrolase [Schlesneria sp.]|jgi:pimeloyl-ACP methyl ester carboxylesterase